MPAMIECELSLSQSDFIMRDHRVYGVSVLPGATFFDIVCRILTARNIDCAQHELRDVVFAEAIAASDQLDRTIRVTFTERDGRLGPDGPGGWDVVARSRPAGAASDAPWTENFTGLVARSTATARPALDVAALKAGASRQRDLRELYLQARSERIEHGPAMTCHGQLWQGPGYLLAELDLDPAATEAEAGFYLHPAKLDAATLVAFGQAGSTGDPFIPMFVERFAAVAPLRGRCFVHVPGMQAHSPSGEVVRASCYVYDEHGQSVAAIEGLTCKRIRYPELMTRLEAGAARRPARVAQPPARSQPEAVSAGAPGPVAAYSDVLRQLTADELGVEAAAVSTGTGFYALGLESLALLRMGQRLEEVIGQRLYPTLLFEHATVDALARHLATEYPNAPGLGARAVLTAWRPLWIPVGLPAVDPAEFRADLVVVGGSPDARQLVRTALPSATLIGVTPGRELAQAGPGSYEVDPRQRDQWSGLADLLAAEGRSVSGYLLLSPGPGESADDGQDPLDQVWALVGALASRPLHQPVELCVLYAGGQDPGAPARSALGAMCRTLSAEVPMVRCRAVELARPGDLAGVGALLSLPKALADVADLRLRDGRIEVLGTAAAELPAAADPIRPGGVYLITGGAGGIASLLASELARHAGVGIILLGRRKPDAGLLRRIEDWERAGARVWYQDADLANADAVQLAIDQALARFGRIDGVLHCAGAVRDGAFFRKDADAIDAVLAPKIRGVRNLDAAIGNRPLDFFVAFSSLAASLASPGQAEYSFANAFLDGFASWRAAQPGRSGVSVSIQWPHWADGGMVQPAAAATEARRVTGLLPIPAATALDALWAGIASGESRLLIGYGDPGLLAGALPGSGAVPVAPSPSELPGERVNRAGGDDESQDIAIIGLAGRYPGAADLTEFWRNLLAGKDCVTEVPASRWDHQAYFDAEKGRQGRSYGRWGGFIDGADQFDPAFFGISRKEAEWMDPQERLFLTTSWQALEDAGYSPHAISGQAVGVFAGVMWNHYQLVDGGAGGVKPTALHSSVANRVSYVLDLTGPSIAVDTACSSALTALHLAVESIRRGESALAIAGGVNVMTHPQKYLQLAQGRWLSEDGRCRSFGAGGTGYVPGEGVGVAVLKPLGAAQAANDHIYGVIKASRLNHGGRTSGFTVPSPVGQAALIRDALRASGVPPASISYIEAHGTGTSLGDPIEVEGLRRAFGAQAPSRCPIGSVKSSIGHLESAAGIAALTKVLLQLQHATLVPSLHADELNPAIDFSTGPFVVQTRAEPWLVPDGALRRAAISAFGAGGANAHLVIEQYCSPARRGTPTPEQIVLLSARSQAALRTQASHLLEVVRGQLAGRQAPDAGPWTARLVTALANRLGVPPHQIDAGDQLADLGVDPASLAGLTGAGDIDPTAALRLPSGGGAVRDAALRLAERDSADLTFLADLAYTLQVGRSPMSCRLAVIAVGGADLEQALSGFLEAEETGRVLGSGTDASLRERAQQWAAGADLKWPVPNQSEAFVPARLSLPAYPFEEERFWLGDWDRAHGQAAVPEPDRPPVTATPAPRPGRQPSSAAVELAVLGRGVAMLTLGEPTFTDQLLAQLNAAFTEIGRRDDIRAVVLTGSGPVFSMGATAETLTDLASGRGRFTDEPLIYQAMPRCPKPVVAAMTGHAAGGGFTFGLYADVVVLASDRSYSANFLKYGFTPGMGATYILSHRLGQALASEMLLTGRSYSGADLARRGAGIDVLPSDQVLEAALDLAQSLADHPAGAVGALKAELNRRMEADLTAAIDSEVLMHEKVLGPESLERISRLAPFARPPASPLVAEPGPAAEPDQAARPDQGEIHDAVRQILGGLLYLEPEDISPDIPFQEMGLDSVGAVELVRDLNQRYKLDLDAVAVFDHPTLPRLAELVTAVRSDRRQLHAEAAQAAAPTAPRTSTLAPERNAPMVSLAPLASGRPPRSKPASDPEEPAPAPDGGTHDIAIIGLSGRFPGAEDLTAFWDNLSAGRQDIGEVPPQRWDQRLFDPRPGEPGKTYSRWGAFLAQVDEFDHAFFHLSPFEAKAMDPQQRLFLQESWKALEDAGYANADAGPRRIGVFVGSGVSDYGELLTRAGVQDSAQTFLGATPSILAARIAYFLNLTGPTLAVDTACSSSLVAVHLASQSILRGECTTALAGGVALMLTEQLHVRTSQVGMLSPTGTSAPFDQSADGIVLGEGVGVVLLKRLDQALADRDAIHAVIRASGINGDGKTNGITAPSARSQAALITEVMEQARVGPDDITYVETHGTGTQLGDPIEVKALTEAFRPGKRASARCGLGSVKANIGHTTMAAGIASLIKVVLALRHCQLPPMPGFSQVSSHIDLADSPFYVVRQLAEWSPGRSGDRIAGISSFGFSGTNCHLILAQPPACEAGQDRAAGYFAVPLSARTGAALDESVRRLADCLDEQGELALPDIAFTLSTGRRHQRMRVAFIVDGVESLRQSLRAAQRGDSDQRVLHGSAGAPGRPATPAPAAADCTKGSADLAASMAAAYVCGEPVGWAARHAGLSPARVSLPGYPFERDRHWPAPASELPSAEAGPNTLVSPSDWIVADHVVGGRPVLPGSACLDLAVQAAQDVLGTGRLRLSSVRWPRPCVVSSPVRLRLSLDRDGDSWRFELSDGSGPGYAQGMVEPLPAGAAAEPLDLDAVGQRCPHQRSPAELYAGFKAAGVDYGPAFRLVRQLRYGPDEAIGTIAVPDSVDQGSGSGADRAADCHRLHPAVMDAALQTAAVLLPGDQLAVPFAIDELLVFRDLPAQSALVQVTRGAHGFTVRITDTDGRLCAQVTGFVLRPVTEPAAGRPTDLLQGMVFTPQWREQEQEPAGSAPRPGKTAVVIAGASQPRLLALARAVLVASGATDATLISLPADGHQDASLRPPYDVIYLLVGEYDAERPVLPVFRFVKSLLATDQASRPLRLTATLAAPGGQPLPEAAEIAGLLRATAGEYPRWSVRCVYLDATSPDPDLLARRIVAEQASERLVMLSPGRRLVQRLVPADLHPPADTARTRAPDDAAAYLVVGGTGGIGYLLCRHLASTRGARLAIVGRTPENAEIRARMAELATLGGQVLYQSADVADPDAMRAVVAGAHARFGLIRGAFHAALVLRDRTMANLDEQTLHAVLAPKTAGVIAMAAALSDEPIDFLLLMSSAASFVDSAGQANYCAASMFEDAYAAQLRARGVPAKVINWGYWGEVGVVADERYARRLGSLGVASVRPAEGLAAITAMMSHGPDQVLVLRADSQGLALFPVDAPDNSAASLAATRAGFVELERLSHALVLAELIRSGLLGEPGSRTSIADLEALTTGARHHLRLLAALLRLLDRAGAVQIQDGTVTVSQSGLTPASSLTSGHRELAAHERLLIACTGALADVLTGRRSHLDVLFPGGDLALVQEVYRGNPVADQVNAMLASAAADRIRRLPAGTQARVLEIGAGTGGSSAAVISACADTGREVSYCYTDVSPAFLQHGKQAFGPMLGGLTFRKLDITADPAGQGFAPGTFHVVFATNVLHATTDVLATLRRAASLLAPGGVLIINEVTRCSDFLTATFGLTPSWWAPDDLSRRLPDSPLLSPHQWQLAMTEVGLRDARIEGLPGTPTVDLEQCLVLATRAAYDAPAAEVPAALAAQSYVRGVFAEMLQFEPGDLDLRSTFETFGVDSLVSLRIVSRLSADLGELPATLLFEYLTIETLAAHLLDEHHAALARVCSPTQPAPPEPAPPEPAPPQPAPEVPLARARHAARPPAGEVAIVGVSGRYPGAGDLRAFWRNLAAGVSSVTEVPPDRWDWRTHFDPNRGVPQRTYSRWGGFLDGIDQFDPAFFGILGRDAAAIDPQERLFLETAWNLLEETGYVGEYAHQPRTGIFAGLMYGTYGQLGATAWRRGQLSGAHSAYWSVANRVSYFFDFQGPSFAVDSACSSSLLALHLACESLRRGECELAIAGGVNLVLHPSHHVSLCALNMLSADGTCKVFDERADGFVPGEGVGAVLLKQYRSALADGDDIWAVVRASVVNAGGKTGGYTVPSARAQQSLIAEALRQADVDPRSVTYIEAHGTGTELGDPIEVRALARALAGEEGGQSGDAGQYCGLGSVKANIGHLEGAAGIAGLTKVLLQMRHRQIAPCVSLDQVSPKIDLAGSPFYLPRRLTEWTTPDNAIPLRAGVSSFGAGGANVHVVVEAAASRPAGPPDSGEQRLFLLSARTRPQLIASAETIVSFLRPAGVDGDGADESLPTLAELSWTSQTGRRELAERAAVSASSRLELGDALAAFVADGTDTRVVVTSAGAGRSETQAGDGHPDDWLNDRDLSALARFWVNGGRLDWRLLWGHPPNRVAYPTYPFERSRHWIMFDDDSPAAAEQHETAERRRRRKLVGETELFEAHRVGGAATVPGAALLWMALSECLAETGKDGLAEAADVRWRRMRRVDGHDQHVEIALRQLIGLVGFRVDDGDARSLPFIDGSFMLGNIELLGEVNDRHAIADRCPAVVTGQELYRELAASGLSYGDRLRVIEHVAVGDGEFLARLASDADLEAGTPRQVAMIDGALQTLASLTRDDSGYLPVGVARLMVDAQLPDRGWVHGREVTRPAAAGKRQFDLRMFDDDGHTVLVMERLEVAPARTKSITQILLPTWVAAPLTGARTALGQVLVVSTDSPLAAAIEGSVMRAGGTAMRADPGQDQDQRRCQDLARALTSAGQLPDQVIYLLDQDQGVTGDDLEQQIARRLHPVLFLTLAMLTEGGVARPLRVVLALSALAAQEPACAALSAPLKTLALEHSRLQATIRYLDQAEPAAAADQLVAELCRAAPVTETVRDIAGVRHARRLTEVVNVPESDQLPVAAGGVYLITGGAGVLGRAFASFLARWPVTVVLIGRGDGDRGIISGLSDAATPGARICYFRVDVTDRTSLQAAVAQVRQRYGPVRGVLHAAAVTRDQRAISKSAADLSEVINPKVLGARNLDQVTAGDPLDFFVLFSSLAAEAGNIGQVDYAFANAYLDEFSQIREVWRAEGRRSGRSVSIGWPLWSDGGLTVDAATLALFERRWAMVPMPTQAGMEAFRRILAMSEPRVVVVQRPAPAPSGPAPPDSTGPGTSEPMDLRPGLERLLRQLGAAFLLVDEAEVDLGADLMDLGFDSIALTQLVGRVNERLGLDLLPTVLFEHPSLAGFADYLIIEEAQAVQGALDSASPGAPATAAQASGAQIAESEPAARTTDIAVIGMAGRLPGADDPGAFWARLVAGDDLVTAIPADRADLRDDPEIRGLRGGFLNDVRSFDAAHFSISPREAALMDPQQRLFLETTWYLIRDAGYRPADLAGSETGLFVGVSTSDYDELQTIHAIPVHAHMTTGSSHAVLANRVSNRFDLRGPSESVDTACSSSLAAVHRAINSITSGECRQAIAGGVNVILSPILFRSFVRAQMLSPDGRCKTFDSTADGYVRGEGVGAVLLKPLALAKADGDHIYAVIKGSAVNHCGRTPSLTAPSPEAQAQVLIRAYRRAGFDPRTVTYLEAHGTGTRLGDPVEIEGMKKAFAELYEERGLPAPGHPHVAIGAVKTNIGHLEAASGMAGLLKVLLCLRHKALPANLNLDSVNPYVRLDGTPFRLLREHETWLGASEDGQRVWRAGVSSFGFGGSNAHVVLEAYSGHPDAQADRADQEVSAVFPLSAPSEAALRAYARRLAEVMADPGTDLVKAAYTLQTGRTEHSVRLVVLADSRGALVSELRAARSGVQDAAAGAAGISQGARGLARDWAAGLDIDWAARWPASPGRTPLPGFPLARTAHWFSEPGTQTTAPAPAPAPAARQRRPVTLRRAQAHKPTRMPEIDLITDSWAERTDPVIAARMADLSSRVQARTDPLEAAAPSWLPFEVIEPTGSGRAAEAMLCRSWPSSRGAVLHDHLFPSWLFSLAENGFTPLRLKVSQRSGTWHRDLDLDHLAAVLAAQPVSFVCLELANNASGGTPWSLSNLTQIRQTLAGTVPLVLDATRVVENALLIADHEPGQHGRDGWEIVRDLLSQADAITMSMSKDFGVDTGGLVATSLAELAQRLTADPAVTRSRVPLATRRTLTVAANDLVAVNDLVRRRMAHVQTMSGHLRAAGVPAISSGAHCVVVDTDALPRFRSVTAPMEKLIAAIYEKTGVRGGPHLDGTDRALRFAVPLGLSDADADAAGTRLAGYLGATDAVIDLRGPDDTPTPLARKSSRVASVAGNLEVLAEISPDARVATVAVPAGELETISAGAGQAVLLMHPFNLGAGVFAYQFRALADHYRLIAVHRPGVGSTSVSGDPGLDRVADLHLQVLDKLGITGSVHLVGASFGGLQAQAFALRYPERCASLSLVASSYQFANRSGDLEKLDRVIAADLDAVIAATGSGRLVSERDWLIDTLSRCESMDPRSGMRYLDVFATHPDMRRALPDISTPALIIRGKHDTIIPNSTTQLMHELIPGSRLLEIDDAGHFPSFTNPDQVNAILAEFFSAHSALDNSDDGRHDPSGHSAEHSGRDSRT